MAGGKITKESVDGLKASARDEYLWDRELKGLAVKVTPTGRKVYLVQYRLGGRAGRCRRVTLGVHGVMTPDQARRAARQVLGDISSGVDVARERQERTRREHDAPTTAKAADEFLSVYVRTKLKPRSAAEYERLLQSIIIPALGHRKIKDVAHADIDQLHHRLRSTPAQANRAIAVLSKLFSWAIRRGQLPSRTNPCRGLERYKERSRNRFLSEVELAGLGLALERGISSGRLSPWAAAAIRLLLFTGARLNEILSLRWGYVDIDNGLVRLPDSKTGAKVIVLNGPARAVLAEVPRRSDNPYVIPGSKDGQHRVDLKKPWQLVCELAGLTGVRLHDLRHTNAALGVASGLSLPLIGGLLGHKQAATTQRYAHLYDDPMREAAEKIGCMAVRAMGSTQPEVKSTSGAK
jgi:integrase